MSKPSDAAPETGKGRSTGSSERGRGLSADDVAAYLRRHPDFLYRHSDLLNGLEPPCQHQGAGVIDFQHAMVKHLREEVGSLTAARDELIGTSRINRSAQSRVHESVLALLDARSFEHFIERVTTDIAVIMDLDLVTLGVERGEDACATHPVPGVFCLPKGKIAEIFGPKGQIRLRAEAEADPEIFGAGAGLVHSEALLRLNIGDRAPDALLALGSRREGNFDEGQGTELLSFLARVLEICFRGWLNLASP